MKIAIINPAFEVSYWGLEHAQPILGKRANMPVASLPLLAALTPPDHEVELFDENVSPLDWERLATFDIVGVTGMSVQKYRMETILGELKRRDVFTVVGGPWVTVQEDAFEGLTNVIFVGEAETTWPQFLNDYKTGNYQVRYEQSEKTDMTTVPVPRHDLLKNKHYLVGSLQFSRGCPFQCEFCDIIVTFGRRPRIKNPEQVVAELEALRAVGMRIVFIVDDNLIGNKKGIKPVLAAVADWQESRGYPMVFSTEASLDLVEDDELLELMARCHISSVFIGIESPNEASLKETKKYQNVRASGGTMIEKIHKIQDAGIEIWCGLIVGFDNDTPEIFEAQKQFLRQSRIAHAMIGLLHAIPKTPLHARLTQEGRIGTQGEEDFGTNVIPAGMSREQLRDGYIQTMSEAYEVEPYFQRLDALFLHGNFRFRVFDTPAFVKSRTLRLRHRAMFVAGTAALLAGLMRRVPDPALRAEYRRRIGRAVRLKWRDPSICFFYAMKCAMHYHHHTMTRDMAANPNKVVSSFGSANLAARSSDSDRSPCSTVTAAGVVALPIAER